MYNMENNHIHTLVFSKLACTELLTFFKLIKSDFASFDNPLFLKEYAAKLSQNADFVVCYSETRTIIGMIAVYMNRPPLCYISHVSVLPVYRKCGIFSAMCHHLEQEAMRHGCNDIKLEVKIDNLPALRAYEKNGFVITEKAKDDSVYMIKSM